MERTQSVAPRPTPAPAPVVTNEMIFEEVKLVHSLINDLIGRVTMLDHEQKLGFENIQKKLQDNNDRTVLTMIFLQQFILQPKLLIPSGK